MFKFSVLVMTSIVGISSSLAVCTLGGRPPAQETNTQESPTVWSDTDGSTSVWKRVDQLGMTFDLKAVLQSKDEKATMLGVHVRRPDGTLRRHLKIKPGMGLVVEQVLSDSAAESAALEIDDVLLKFDDQWLVNEEQLTALVRNSEPGQVVTLSLVRDGTHREVEVTLKEGTTQGAGGILQLVPHFNHSNFGHEHISNPAFTNCAACHSPSPGTYRLNLQRVGGSGLNIGQGPAEAKADGGQPQSQAGGRED